VVSLNEDYELRYLANQPEVIYSFFLLHTTFSSIFNKQDIFYLGMEKTWCG